MNNGDFHLKSTGGRWDGSKWVTDTDASPCINAGNPASDYTNEPEPNGNRINMGVFGNTFQASKTGNGSVQPTTNPAGGETTTPMTTKSDGETTTHVATNLTEKQQPQMLNQQLPEQYLSAVQQLQKRKHLENHQLRK